MGDVRVGAPSDPRSTVGVIIDAGVKTLDLVAPAGININGAPLSGAYAPIDPDLLTVGEESVPRRLVVGSTLTNSATLRLSHFTARKSETITQVRMWTHATAAAATPTLVRIGLYTVAANGDIALVASTANDTTLFATANTSYTRAFSASYDKVAGQRYAVGALIVSGTTTPTLLGNGILAAHQAEMTAAPRIASAVTALADLPASVVSASLVANGQYPYAVLLPA